MTTEFSTPATLADRDLLRQLERAVGQERHATAQVIALLMEVDARRLYARESCSSLFTYCVQVLRFSEHAAYLRIEAARAARRFPLILERLGGGSLHLTAVSLLAPHLTDANHVSVLDAAAYKCKRDVEQLVASLRPRPDAPAVVRRLPEPRASLTIPEPSATKAPVADAPPAPPVAEVETIRSLAIARPSTITPLAPERFKVQFTVSRDTHDKLRQAQDLFRHVVPNGDPAAIFDRALTLLLAELSRTKFAATERPRVTERVDARNSRYVPAAVKREVWQRDGGQCAFRGTRGRCTETGFLEFHHVVAYANGGATTAGNLELRCRAHNMYEADREFRKARDVPVGSARSSHLE